MSVSISKEFLSLNDVSKKDSFKESFINDSLTKGWTSLFSNIYSKYIVNGKKIPQEEFERVRNCTDYESFASYFILNEIAKDPKRYYQGTLVMKNMSKCYAGAFGRVDTNFDNNNYKGWLFAMERQAPCWWHVLIRDTLFQEMIKKSWRFVVETFYMNVEEKSYLDEFLDSSLDSLNIIGNFSSEVSLENSLYSTTFAKCQDEVCEVKKYLKNRTLWIEENLDNLFKEVSLTN